MQDFSQNGEQKIILEYFKNINGDHVPTFLDLGANDGKTLSNTHALAILGSDGHIVEPCSIPYEKAKALYAHNKYIQVSNCAIGTENGEFEIFSSDSHLKNGDTDLLSTLKKSELKRWGNTQKFTPQKCAVLDFETFLKKSTIKKFDFISIDIEGMDYDVLIQMDLNELGCKMLCIETNSIEDHKYIDYCAKFGMNVIHKNHENLIFTV